MKVAHAAKWLPFVEPLGVKCPGAVGWVHGANRSQALKAALADPKVHFIEGDISVVGDEVIMAHPPIVESDLSFESWLDLTVAAGKGAKLDFKSPDAVAPCLSYAKRVAAGRIPLCANADILAGPGGEPPTFNPREFIDLCNNLLPQAFLSVGWTVEAGDRIGYTEEMLAAMREALDGVDATFSLCFHAAYLPNIWPRIEELLKQTDYTITVWGRVEDPALLSWIRANTPPERCFYDMQSGDGRQIHL